MNFLTKVRQYKRLWQVFAKLIKKGQLGNVERALQRIDNPDMWEASDELYARSFSKFVAEDNKKVQEDYEWRMKLILEERDRPNVSGTALLAEKVRGLEARIETIERNKTK